MLECSHDMMMVAASSGTTEGQVELLGGFAQVVKGDLDLLGLLVVNVGGPVDHFLSQGHLLLEGFGLRTSGGKLHGGLLQRLGGGAQRSLVNGLVDSDQD